MSEGTTTAVIAGCVAVTVAYLTQFVSENYKRHRDAAAMAAAIAGELASYKPAWPILEAAFTNWMRLVGIGDRDHIPFRTIERPKDLVIDEMVPKLGLLGAKRVEMVVTVYANLRAFRIGLELITKEHGSMPDDELMGRLQTLLITLDRAGKAAEVLVPELHAMAELPFMKDIPMKAVFPAVIVPLCAMLVWFGGTIARVENQRYALSLGMCQSDPLKILSKPECLKVVRSRSGWWWHLGYALRGG